MSVSGDSSGGMHVISGLMPSTTYSIQMAANTSADTGPYSTASYQLTAGVTSKFNVTFHYLATNRSCSSFGC